MKQAQRSGLLRLPSLSTLSHTHTHTHTHTQTPVLSHTQTNIHILSASARGDRVILSCFEQTFTAPVSKRCSSGSVRISSCTRSLVFAMRALLFSSSRSCLYCLSDSSLMCQARAAACTLAYRLDEIKYLKKRSQNTRLAKSLASPLLQTAVLIPHHNG